MKKIRWGILSTAKIARERVIPAIQRSSNGEVVALASRDKARAEELAHRLGIARAYGSYEELLSDAAIDAIYNPLPTGMHVDWSLRCAEAGKPVLCEKPLAPSAAEARRMIAGFAAREVLLAEALMYKYHPLTKRVEELVRSGTAGRPHIARATFHCAPQREGNFRFSAAAGGGALLDLGCYCVSVLRMLVGEEACGVTAAAYCPPETGVDESVAATLAFPSGALGVFTCSLRSPFDCAYELTGERGRILVDRGGMVAWPGGEFSIKIWQGDTYEEVAIPAADHYQLMVEDFATAVMRGTRQAASLHDTLQTLETMDRVRAAWRRG